MKKMLNLMISALIFSAIPAFAQHSHEQAVKTQNALITAKGVVKVIDLENKKVTIEHEAIEALSWPAMKMRFAYEDESLIKEIKIDDSVEFGFVQQGKISLLKTIKAI
ncbi:MAG: copper-binding protein [Campylobacteraceae bacterium]|jgi:Cu(I)/Ag(I) efflux system protein CusF|nr:copper-binding protein [Campylobacteraceae bacterium]